MELKNTPNIRIVVECSAKKPSSEIYAHGKIPFDILKKVHQQLLLSTDQQRETKGTGRLKGMQSGSLNLSFKSDHLRFEIQDQTWK